MQGVPVRCIRGGQNEPWVRYDFVGYENRYDSDPSRPIGDVQGEKLILGGKK